MGVFPDDGLNLRFRLRRKCQSSGGRSYWICCRFVILGENAADMLTAGE